MRFRAGAFAVLMGIAVVYAQSQPYEDMCPEQCGAVLKACLDERADRHVCMDVADKCLTGCRAKLRSGRPAGAFAEIPALRRDGTGCA